MLPFLWDRSLVNEAGFRAAERFFRTNIFSNAVYDAERDAPEHAAAAEYAAAAERSRAAEQGRASAERSRDPAFAAREQLRAARAVEAEQSRIGEHYWLDISYEECPFSGGLSWRSQMQCAVNFSCAEYGIFHPQCGLEVLFVEKLVPNPRLLAQYEWSRESLRRSMPPQGLRSWLEPWTNVVPPLDGSGLGIALDAECNEVLVWHGTSRDAVEGICSAGFLGGCGDKWHGHFGPHSYFSDAPLKADRFTTGDASGLRCLLLTRVCMGLPQWWETGMECPTMREPEQVPFAPPGRLYDSVIGAPCPCGPHTEYVLFDGQRAIPEFLVTYRRVPW